jgi:hypothetical protein
MQNPGSSSIKNLSNKELPENSATFNINLEQMHKITKPMLLAVLAIGSFLVPSVAQGQLSGKLGAGFQTSGFGIETPDFSSQWRTGSHYNLTLQYGRRFYVESGLVLVNSSQRIQPEATFANPIPEPLTANLMAIHVPLKLGFHLFEESANLNFRGFGGVDMRMKVSERGNSDYDIGDFRFANFGWIIGAGVNYYFMYADLSYHGGLTSTFKSDIADFRNRQHLVMLTIGVHLFR